MTTTTLRPNASISGTPTGAASVHAALSDDSDSSYAPAICSVDLGTVAMSGGVTKTLTLRARAGKTVAESTLKTLFVGPASSSAGSPASLSATIYATSIQDFAGVAVAVSLTQAEVDGLSLLAQTSESGGADTTVRFYELYADLVWVAVPVTTVAAVSPDPYTASNIIPIAWSNTLDSDGGGQTRYEVKVFTDAQYLAGGFDADTSTPYWTSEEVVGSALTVNTGALATGDTYRAYVRVAQTVNGVAHWSDWAFDTFDVDVTTTDVDTVTATGIDATARIQIDVARVALSEAWELIEVQRSTDSGATWTPVRFANYVDCTADADDFQVFDYEVGNGTTALYRARATYLLSGLPVTGEWVQSTPAESWSSTSAWLKSPLDPTKNMSVILETPFAAQEREVRVGVFKVIGRRIPVVISDVLSAPFTSIMIRTESAVELGEMLDLLGDVLLLFQPLPEALTGEGQVSSQYVSILNVTEAQRVPYYSEYRLWTVAFVEMDAPADSTAGQ